jgi:outer membrane protein
MKKNTDGRLRHLPTFLLAAAIFILCAGFPAFSQQITRVAVLDMARVLAAFPKDMAALRNFENRKAEIQAEADRMAGQIKTLQSRKAILENSGDFMGADSLGLEITARTAELKAYVTARQNELDLLAKALSSNTSFVQKLGVIIAQVAEAEGYSVVLNLKPQDQNANIVLWNSPAIDITDKVILALGDSR